MTNSIVVRRGLDVAMSIGMLLLMSYQIAGDAIHEWLGIVMTLLVVVHNFWHRSWYKSLLKGSYMPLRMLFLIINGGLLVTFALTAWTGMSMSREVVPFLEGMLPRMTAKQWHLGFSYWCFIWMSLHVGLHLQRVLSLDALRNKGRKSMAEGVLILAGAYGIYVLIRDNVFDYLTFQTHFVMFDFTKSSFGVLLDTWCMSIPFVLVAYYGSMALIRDKND